MGESGDRPRVALTHLLANQEGVVARRQVLECELTSAFVRQRLRSWDWVAACPGVYVTHTGPPTERQRQWIAVLWAMPAALSHESAILAASSSTASGPIHVVVDARRRLSSRPGVVVHYSRHLAERALMHTHPPRVRPEHAVLDVAGRARTDFDAVACLSGAVQARATTADRLLAALASRQRTSRRDFLERVLFDVRDGTCSVLEHCYLRDVERAHGLPASVRQTPTGVGRRGFRDVEYPDWRLIVELDGRAHHDTARARDSDLERDLDAIAYGRKRTIRLGWGADGRPPLPHRGRHRLE
ncbi:MULTISPECIES: hypothetical protein [Gordonia]|uniref:hypothetical protein n=1 Tax=Gordonia TaxID=2053 RepID=UPI0012FA49DA|nr:MULTISPECIES: hypothetical protein [Gordonia]